MKNTILKLVMVGSLVVGFSGCLSDDEKKAKDIVVNEIITENKKTKEIKSNEGVFPDNKSIMAEIKRKRAKRKARIKEKKLKKEVKE